MTETISIPTNFYVTIFKTCIRGAALIFPDSFLLKRFTNSGQTIVTAIRQLAHERRTIPMHITCRVLPELETVSWSSLHVLQHLELVNETTGEIIEELVQNGSSEVNYSIETITPKSAGSLKEYEGSIFVFQMRIKRCGKLNTTGNHYHPQLGLLNAKQWLTFSVFQQIIFSRYLKQFAGQNEES